MVVEESGVASEEDGHHLERLQSKSSKKKKKNQLKTDMLREATGNKAEVKQHRETCKAAEEALANTSREKSKEQVIRHEVNLLVIIM